MHAPDTRLRAAPLAWAMLLHRQRCEQGLCPGWIAPSPTGIAHRSCCIFENFGQMRQTRPNTSRADSTTHLLLLTPPACVGLVARNITGRGLSRAVRGTPRAREGHTARKAAPSEAGGVHELREFRAHVWEREDIGTRDLTAC